MKRNADKMIVLYNEEKVLSKLNELFPSKKKKPDNILELQNIMSSSPETYSISTAIVLRNIPRVTSTKGTEIISPVLVNKQYCYLTEVIKVFKIAKHKKTNTNKFYKMTQEHHPPYFACWYNIL